MLLFSFSVGIAGQARNDSVARDDNLSPVVTFRIGTSAIVPDYKNNRSALDALDSLLHNCLIDSVLIIAAASPIGAVSLNNRLSRARASAMKNYIVRKYPNLDRSLIRQTPVGIDWQGFRAAVEADADSPHRQPILTLLDSLSDENSLLQGLKRLPPKTRNYLMKEIFPQLQYATVRFQMKKDSYAMAALPLPDIVGERFVMPVVMLYWQGIAGQARNDSGDAVCDDAPVYAVGSNLLYDAAVLPNLSAEVAFDADWSVLLQGYSTWLQTRAPDYWSYRIQMAWVEGRRWWGRKREPLRGIFTGVYGAIGSYDIRLFPTGQEALGTLSRFSYSLGLTAGYSMPIARRWNLEFSAGAGFLAGQYNEYNHSLCADCYPKRSTKERRYFGPTKAAVSLVYIINGGGNERK